MIEHIPTEFEVLDDRFRTCRGDPRVERLYGDCRWAEGPVYVPGGRYLVWSDIPNDRLLRWDEPTGRVGVFRQPAGYANGNTLDAQSRLVTCEHGNRRVSRTEHDGSISTISSPCPTRPMMDAVSASVAPEVTSTWLSGSKSRP